MHFSDENSTIIEDDMTVDQKVQTTDFWTGRTIFQYGEDSGSHKGFALASKNRPGPHRDKREAKNEKKAQRFKSIESVTERKPGCMTKPVNLVRYDMSSFLDSCVDAYCQLAKVEKSSLPKVQTSFTEAGIARPTLDEKEAPDREEEHSNCERFHGKAWSSIRLQSACDLNHRIIVWCGNELCGKYGIDPLPMWDQDAPEGDYMQLMADCKRHMTWWNKQLMELGVDQAAVVGEPDPIVYGLGLTFTHWMDAYKKWFFSDILPLNDRLRWITNNVLPPNLELRDLFHAQESEYNRRHMLEYFNSMFHLLHVTDILRPQVEMARLKPMRDLDDCIFRDVIPRKDEMPESLQQNLLRDSYVKVSIPTEYAAEGTDFTFEEIRARPPDFTCHEDDDNPWDEVDPNEHEGPSVGKAKASHAAPESKASVTAKPGSEAAASSSSSGPPPKAAVAGQPARENVIEGTILPLHHGGECQGRGGGTCCR
eukprot:s3411_g5.t1